MVAVIAAAVSAWLGTRGPSRSAKAPPQSPATSAQAAPSTSAAPTTAAATSAPTVASTVTSTAPPTTALSIAPPVTKAGSVTYTIPAGTPIDVAATRACWVEARAGAGGPVSHVGTLQAGQSLTLASPVWIRMGNPANLRVTAGGTPLQLPVGPGDLVVTSS